MFKVPFNFDSQAHSLEHYTVIDDDMPSLTKQEFESDADVNEIARRYGLTGQLPPAVEGWYGDTNDVPLDLMSAYNLASEAAKSWASMPDAVKAKFGTASNFVNFIESPDFIPSDLVNLLKEPTSDFNSEQVLPPSPPSNTPSPAPNLAPEPIPKE